MLLLDEETKKKEYKKRCVKINQQNKISLPEVKEGLLLKKTKLSKNCYFF